jgi:hypothetical protein
MLLDEALQIWRGVAVVEGEQGGEFAGDVFRYEGRAAASIMSPILG